jgi:hypothetical protein
MVYLLFLPENLWGTFPRDRHPGVRGAVVPSVVCGFRRFVVRAGHTSPAPSINAINALPKRQRDKAALLSSSFTHLLPLSKLSVGCVLARTFSFLVRASGVGGLYRLLSFLVQISGLLFPSPALLPEKSREVFERAVVGVFAVKADVHPSHMTLAHGQGHADRLLEGGPCVLELARQLKLLYYVRDEVVEDGSNPRCPRCTCSM